MDRETVIQELTNRYKLPHRLFGCTEKEYGSNEWRRRRLFANIIVGGSRDVMAVKGATLLFENYTFEYLADRKNYVELRTDIANLLEINCDIKYAGKKADYILDTAYALQENHDGIVPDTTEELMAFPGVGKHAASIVLGLAFGQQTFGVDLHVRRILKRMRLVERNATDRVIEKTFAGIPNSTHLSRALVAFGQDVCQYRPVCNKCVFNNGNCDKTILK